VTMPGSLPAFSTDFSIDSGIGYVHISYPGLEA